MNRAQDDVVYELNWQPLSCMGQLYPIVKADSEKLNGFFAFSCFSLNNMFLPLLLSPSNSLPDWLLASNVHQENVVINLVNPSIWVQGVACLTVLDLCSVFLLIWAQFPGFKQAFSLSPPFLFLTFLNDPAGIFVANFDFLLIGGALSFPNCSFK